MIKSVRIKNFKGLRDFNLQDVARVNLIGGKNNAGKTTILEAMFMFYDRLNPGMLLRLYNWRGISETPLTRESLFSPIFSGFELNNTVEIEVVDHKGFIETMSVKYKEGGDRVIKVQGIQGQIKTDETITALHSLEVRYKSSKYKEQQVNYVLDNTGFGMEIVHARQHETPAVFLAAKVHGDPNQNAIRFGELDINGQSEVIINFLKIIEPRLKNLSSITLSTNNSMLYGDIGLGKKVPISYMGDGISRLLTILLAIVSNKNGVIFIDEIENGIHYSVMDKVWEVISKAALDYNCQVFATTHSYECLNAALTGIKNEMKDEFRYFRVERSKMDDKIIPKTFNYEVLESAINQGWEVR